MTASDRPRILIVDDDAALRSALTFSLELEGFAVEAFESGEALVARGLVPDPGCLVLDYHLPGMDGLALLALLRARGVALPALIITSLPTRSLAARAAAAGAAIIEKPLLCDALAAAIRAAVRKPIEPV
ncbi:response regulator [Sphingosinicella sp. LY1275]|uniref:response regulator n=1 Tax=Sphingosinicella sp. LY1275 TaxID=3095379 RepID=UPI002ADEC70F|nr:response regulator [Sphingosinicella sp. LY1275]MEA1015538.1 response regulator [Sphingosinicella sp. LY1275]